MSDNPFAGASGTAPPEISAEEMKGPSSWTERQHDAFRRTNPGPEGANFLSALYISEANSRRRERDASAETPAFHDAPARPQNLVQDWGDERIAAYIKVNGHEAYRALFIADQKRLTAHKRALASTSQQRP